MGLFAFFRAHLVPSILMGVGVGIAIVGYAADAYLLWTAHFRPWFVQLCGFLIFVVGVVTMLYQFKASLGATTALSPPPALVPSPPRNVSAAIPSPPALGAAPALEKASEERKFVPESFVNRFLKLKMEQHTDLQTTALLEPHVGEWMNLSGFLFDINRFATGEYMVTISQAPDVQGHFRLFFEKKWHDHLSLIKPGEPIKLAAKIISDTHGVRLARAELV